MIDPKNMTDDMLQNQLSVFRANLNRYDALSPDKWLWDLKKDTPEYHYEITRRGLADRARKLYYKRFEALRYEVLNRMMQLITPAMRKLTHEHNLQMAEISIASSEVIDHVIKVPDTREYRYNDSKRTLYTQKAQKEFNRKWDNAEQFITDHQDYTDPDSYGKDMHKADKRLVNRFVAIKNQAPEDHCTEWLLPTAEQQKDSVFQSIYALDEIGV